MIRLHAFSVHRVRWVPYTEVALSQMQSLILKPGGATRRGIHAGENSKVTTLLGLRTLS